MSELIDEVKEKVADLEVLVLKGIDKVCVMVTGHDDPKLLELIAEHGPDNVMVSGKTVAEHQAATAADTGEEVTAADQVQALADAQAAKDAELKASRDEGYAAGKADAEAAAKVESDAAGELFATAQAELEAANAKVTELTAQLDEATKPKDPA